MVSEYDRYSPGSETIKSEAIIVTPPRTPPREAPSATPGPTSGVSRQAVLIAAVIGAFVVLITVIVCATVLLTTAQKYSIELVDNQTPDEPEPDPQPKPEPCFCNGHYCFNEDKVTKQKFEKKVLDLPEVWGQSDLLIFHLTLQCAPLTNKAGGNFEEFFYTLTLSFHDLLADGNPKQEIKLSVDLFNDTIKFKPADPAHPFWVGDYERYGLKLSSSFASSTDILKFKECSFNPYLKTIDLASIVITVQRQFLANNQDFEYKIEMYQAVKLAAHLLAKPSSTKTFQRETGGKAKVTDVIMSKKTDIARGNTIYNCDCLTFGVDPKVTAYWLREAQACCKTCRYYKKGSGYTDAAQCVGRNATKSGVQQTNCGT